MHGPSPFALAHRFLVLLGLIGGALRVWVRIWLQQRSDEGEGDSAALVEAERRFARRFVAVAVRFKGGLIKIGQVASLRVDVLPPEVSEELARLQDRVDPHPIAEVEAQIVHELGAPIASCFAAFEREPIASASLGQVHAARLPDGRKVAVKVLYPGVERSVAIDLVAVRVGIWLFDFLTVADLRTVYREIRESLLGEMDYEREGRAAEEVARNLAADPEVTAHVRVPAIHWPTTRRRVLTMEFIEGVKINDRAALAAHGLDSEEIARWAVRAFLHMIFRDGFFHCDPHPGNLLVDAEGRIGIVDFGMNKRLAPAVMAMLRENLLATVTRDARALRPLVPERGHDRRGRRARRRRRGAPQLRPALLQPDAARGRRPRLRRVPGPDAHADEAREELPAARRHRDVGPRAHAADGPRHRARAGHPPARGGGPLRGALPRGRNASRRPARERHGLSRYSTTS